MDLDLESYLVRLVCANFLHGEQSICFDPSRKKKQERKECLLFCEHLHIFFVAGCSYSPKNVSCTMWMMFDLLEWYHYETSHPSRVFFLFVVLPLYVLFGNTSRHFTGMRFIKKKPHTRHWKVHQESERVHTWMFGWDMFFPEIYCESLSLYKMVNIDTLNSTLIDASTHILPTLFHSLIPSFSNSKNIKTKPNKQTKCHTICHTSPNPL